MPVIAKGGVDTLVSAPPAVYLRNVRVKAARKLRESSAKANAVGEKRLISALSMPSQAPVGRTF